MRISDWSSDVCSSDLRCAQRWAPSPCRPSHESCRSAAPDRSSALAGLPDQDRPRLVAVPLDLLDQRIDAVEADLAAQAGLEAHADGFVVERSEEHTSELQSLMRISSAVFCLKKINSYSNRPNTTRIYL